MSDNELPKLSPEAERREAEISRLVANCISRGYDKISEDLDDLHKRGYTDDDLVKALRDQGETDLLDWYAEWADIDLREDDNTTMNPVVPDPGDAPSYAEVFAADGITADNLEQALVEVATTRIEHGIFFAERGRSGNWHIYKRRSHQDNGAFIATYDTREQAMAVLASLGSGDTGTDAR